MRLLLFLLILLVLLSWVCCTPKKEKSVDRASYVIDGDTFMLEDGTTIRLADVDCPELGQNYGIEAKIFTDNFLGTKPLDIQPLYRDKYGRTVARVYVDNTELNSSLISNGLGWVNKRYCSQSTYNLFLKARYTRVGLWSDTITPISPYVYRNFKHYK